MEYGSKFQDLNVWKKSHQFTLEVYRLTDDFDKCERFSLASQMKRASYSIPMNIAEGKTSGSAKNFIRYLNIARGSASECEYQLILCRDLGYINKEEYKKLSNETIVIQKMLSSLITSLRSK